jgi:hypothetical protein
MLGETYQPLQFMLGETFQSLQVMLGEIRWLRSLYIYDVIPSSLVSFANDITLLICSLLLLWTERRGHFLTTLLVLIHLQFTNILINLWLIKRLCQCNIKSKTHLVLWVMHLLTMFSHILFNQWLRKLSHRCNLWSIPIFSWRKKSLRKWSH